LPKLRQYISAAPGDILVNRDYSQQQLRTLGHYEDGPLMAAYRDNPWMDIHEFAQTGLKRDYNIDLPRTPVKTMGFGLIFGMGIGKLAASMGVDIPTAKKIRAGYLGLMPGIRTLMDALKDAAKAGLPVKTWGGRLYYCEAPAMVNGKLRRFEYKMLNYLIQPSEADMVKEAMIRADEMGVPLVIQCHDELMAEVATEFQCGCMATLREAMEGLPGIDVPMLSEGKIGPSWGALVQYDQKGVICQ
jgi:DNA polymerase-1